MNSLAVQKFVAKQLPVSAFVITFNEAEKIENCLASLSDCAEIILIDCGSTDGTVAIAEGLARDGLPVRVFHQAWLGYAAQKQCALEKCTQPWCLSIDADERLDEALREHLPVLIACDEAIVGWKLARRGYLPGYGFTQARVKERTKLRLIRNGQGAFNRRQMVHERIVTTGKVRTAKFGSLLHYTPHLIDDQIPKENKYSTLKADMIIRDDLPRNPWRLLVSPAIYFFRLYFMHGLWRCGFPGYIQAATGAVYSFLTEAKVYQRRRSDDHSPKDEMA